MKSKFISCFLISILLIAISAIAAPFPMPVSGQVTLPGFSVLTGLDIEQKNLRTGWVEHFNLDASGFFITDWANYPCFLGDEIEITVSICKERPECKKIITLNGDPIHIELGMIGGEEAWNVIKETVTVYRCNDGRTVDSLEECGIPIEKIITEKEILQDVVTKIKEVLTTTKETLYICPDGSEVEDKEDCKSGSWIAYIIGILCGIFGAFAGGWKIYNGKFKHYHRGIKSYHDPSTRHSSAKYRHTPWDEGVWKCIKETKEIQQGIDLSGK